MAQICSSLSHSRTHEYKWRSPVRMV
jgi:hypothetical protein